MVKFLKILYPYTPKPIEITIIDKNSEIYQKEKTVSNADPKREGPININNKTNVTTKNRMA